MSISPKRKSHVQTHSNDSAVIPFFSKIANSDTCQLNTDNVGAFRKCANRTIEVSVLPSMVRSNMEPIIIDDYHQHMHSYFTQAASNVTIYLDRFNEREFGEDSNGTFLRENNKFYHVNNSGVIDLTKHSDYGSGEKTQQNANKKCTQQFSHVSHPYYYLNFNLPNSENMPPFMNTTNNVTAQEETSDRDEPEFIDISKLVPQPDMHDCLLSSPVPAKSKNLSYRPQFLKKSLECKVTLTTNVSNENCKTTVISDDEVIFMGEFSPERFKKDDLTAKDDDVTAIPLDLCSYTSNMNRYPAPRRNPKRKVQILKESYDLAVKLSDADIYYGRTRKEYYMENDKRSSTYGASIVNQSLVGTDDEWGKCSADGSHERPIYNACTKKIRKNCYGKRKERMKKPTGANTASSTRGCPRRRKVAIKTHPDNVKSKGAKGDKERTYQINNEFSALTHETLQHVINYVIRVKEYNKIKSGSLGQSLVQERKRSNSIERIGVAKKLLGEKDIEQNVIDAAHLLADTTILYSMANDLGQMAIARYLDSFVKKPYGDSAETDKSRKN